MGKKKVFGVQSYYDDDPDAYQKRARKYFEQHFYSNDEDKKKAEKWFERDGATRIADLLKAKDYKRAASQLATSFNILPSDQTLEDIKKFKREKYSVRNRTIDNAYTQRDRALETQIKEQQKYAKRYWDNPNPEDWKEMQRLTMRYRQILQASKNRIARLEQANKPQEQLQSRLAEPSKPKTTDKKSSGASARGRANGVG